LDLSARVAVWRVDISSVHVPRRGLAAWLGVRVIVQNIVACLFNTYLLEFTLGWIYVFGVGVLGGMMFRQRASARMRRHRVKGRTR
jgi:hypothetical protein